MKVLMRTALAVLALLLLAASPVFAAPQSYAVLPFQINGPSSYRYLEKAIPQMFSSRLYWKDHFHPVASDAAAKAALPGSEADVAKTQAALGANYAVWGSVTIVGDDCSLDVRVRDPKGKVWPKSSRAKVNDLIAALQTSADAVSAEVFGRASAQPANAAAEPKVVNQMNEAFVVNETQNQQVYLNPQFRYQGNAAGDARMRSQSLPFSALGMLVEDVDGDGKNEVLLLDDKAVYAYRWEGGRLAPAGEFRPNRYLDCLNINSIDLNRDGRREIVITAVDEKSNEPESFILNYAGGQFTEVMTRIGYFLNVVKLPPDFIPVLVGQKTDQPRLFRPGVYEMAKNGDSLMQIKRLDLPEGANVFNFVWVPGGSKGDGDKIVTLTDTERLRVHTAKGGRVAETDESYSGTAKGISIEPNMPGMGRDKVLLKSQYYIPMRMLAVNLDRDDNWELLVNRPISTASQFFERYRFFPQGEIHALYWDGVGLGLQWKTRRVKGSVADFALADVNNDGVQDLVLCVNTPPGALGMESRKTMVLAYPLDLSKVDPNTAAANEQLDQ